MQAILNDRPAQAGAVLQTTHRGFFGAATTRDLVLRHPVGILVEDEGVAVELVGARPRHGGDDGRTSLLVLGLEVLADDAKLLHRALREGGAAAVVLTGHAAVVDQRLAVLAVDEDVDRLGGLTAGGNRPLGVILGHAQARSQGGEVQEVAADLRQIVDLLLRHIGGDFRRTHFEHAAAGDDDVTQLGRAGRGLAGRSGGDVQVQGSDLAQGQGDGLLRRLTVSAGDLDAVGAGTQARQDITPVGADARACRIAGRHFGRDHGSARLGGLAVIDGAPKRGGRVLSRGASRDGHAQGQGRGGGLGQVTCVELVHPEFSPSFGIGWRRHDVPHPLLNLAVGTAAVDWRSTRIGRTISQLVSAASPV